MLVEVAWQLGEASQLPSSLITILVGLVARRVAHRMLLPCSCQLIHLHLQCVSRCLDEFLTALQQRARHREGYGAPQLGEGEGVGVLHVHTSVIGEKEIPWQLSGMAGLAADLCYAKQW